ncbi:MAG: 23S rRNA (guanosine(2251)-2'-O)-methyltransferase RlmB [Bacteroidota bacterium]
MIYGLRAVIETLDAGRDLEKVFIQKNLQGELAKELWAALKRDLTPISKVPVERLNRFTRKNHQGVVAFVSPVKYYTLDSLVQQLYEDGKAPLLVVLDGVTDVRNFGAIARTAECMGADGLIIPTKGAAQVNAESMKTSAGALSSLPVCRTDDLLAALQYLKDSGLSLMGCTEKAEQSIQELDFFSPVTVVLGSEEGGISDEVLKLCDHLGQIPMHGTIQSLNVSVAAAMLLYEVTRQRG